MRSPLIFTLSLGLGLAACGSSSSSVPTRDAGTSDASTSQDASTADASTADASTADAGARLPDGVVSRVGGDIIKDPSSFTAQGSAKQVLFVHHSTGGVIYGAGVQSAYEALRPDDSISEVWGPGDAGDNDPSSYEDTWVNGSELGTLSQDVIIFKNCFTSDPIDDEGELQYYKNVYTALKAKMKAKDGQRFIAWTVPPMTRAQAGSASRALTLDFYRWMLNEWDEPGDNIFIFDYRLLATRGALEYQADADADGADDSHPGSAIAQLIAPCFARRIAEVANGDGDTTTRTGGCSVE